MPWADSIGLRRALRHHGITDTTIDAALSLFSRLDTAAYATSRATLQDAGSAALSLYLRIDEEARAIPRQRRSRRAGAAAVLLLAAGVMSAQEGLSPRALFERGVQAYVEDNSAAAARDCFEAARAEPASASAWANAGTASWESADTARAVVGWQRALRLDPLDDGARRLLTLVGADAGASNAAVWPVPRRVPAWAGLGLWIGAWLMLWRRRRRRVAYGAMAAAVVCMSISTVHMMRLTDKRMAVVARPAPLRSLPALGSEAGITPLTGELVRVIERSGVWVRVKASTVRDGWIDAARVIDFDGQPLRN
jgi:hypothetical protein